MEAFAAGVASGATLRSMLARRRRVGADSSFGIKMWWGAAAIREKAGWLTLLVSAGSRGNGRPSHDVAYFCSRGMDWHWTLRAG